MVYLMKTTEFKYYYTTAPRRGRGVYCFTSVRLSVLPSVQDIFRRIFLRNLIFGHKVIANAHL
jgi:hypothetical protein